MLRQPSCHGEFNGNMISAEEMNEVVEEYADMVRRICYSYLKDYHDTEDIFQTVFLKYMKQRERILNKEHEKAWLVRVSINACKDHWKSFFRRHTVSFAEIDEPFYEPEDLGYVREAVLELPKKYREVIYLYYFEGYQTPEIASILRKKENTVYSLMKRGKELLKERLGGDRID